MRVGLAPSCSPADSAFEQNEDDLKFCQIITSGEQPVDVKAV